MLGDSLNDDIREFVDDFVDSLVGWAIIVFFYENPGTRDRVEDLARNLGRRNEDVAKAAEELCAKGILNKHVYDNETVYTFQPRDDVKEKVAQFVRSLDERSVRLKILSHVLEKVV